MKLTLERFYSDDKGTFGKIVIDDFLQFYTVERPWNNNKPFTSCIPKGEYTLVPHRSNKYGDVLAVVNNITGVTHYKEVDSKRYAILIHPANYPKDVEGCIGLGDNFIPSIPMVTNSRKSCNAFYNLVDPNEIHSLTIIGE